MDHKEFAQRLQMHFVGCHVYWDPGPDQFFTWKGAILKIQCPSRSEPFVFQINGEAWIESDEGCIEQVIHHAEIHFSGATGTPTA